MRRISYVRPVRHWSTDRQREANGPVAAEYGAEQRDAALASSREDTELVVARFRVLGTSVREIREAATTVREAGGVIIETDTGRNTREHGAELMADAVEDITNERRAAGKRNGKAGAEARWSGKDRMPDDEAIVIWRNAALNTDDALADMWGWSKSTADRRLGSRGVPRGPKPTK